MSCVKEVEITGVLPFDCDNDAEMCFILGKLNAPTTGVRIAWTGEAGYEPNQHGGRTCMVNFRISGQEALPDPFLARMVKAIKGAGGRIVKATARDIENGGRPYDLAAA